MFASLVKSRNWRKVKFRHVKKALFVKSLEKKSKTNQHSTAIFQVKTIDLSNAISVHFLREKYFLRDFIIFIQSFKNRNFLMT